MAMTPKATAGTPGRRALDLFSAALLVLATALMPAGARAQEELLDDAQAAFEAGDTIAAERLYDQAVKHPDIRGEALREALLRRGAMRLALGRLAEATADFELVMGQDWCLPDAYALRAVAAMASGEPELALAYAGHAVRLDPDYAAGYLTRARILEELGFAGAASGEDARGEARVALGDVEPGSMVLCDIGLGRRGFALRGLDEQIARRDATDENLALRAYLDAGSDADAARRTLEEIAARAPDTMASLWLALLSPPDVRRALLEARLERDSLDLLAGLALADGEAATGGDPFAAWASIVAGRPVDLLAQEAIALGAALPLAPERAREMAEQALRDIAQPFGMARALALAIALDSQGDSEAAAELRARVAFGRMVHVDPLLMLLAEASPP